MNATDFLDFILEKHHQGYDFDEEYRERDPTWERENILWAEWENNKHPPDGCELIDDVDK